MAWEEGRIELAEAMPSKLSGASICRVSMDDTRRDSAKSPSRTVKSGICHLAEVSFILLRGIEELSLSSNSAYTKMPPIGGMHFMY